ncbi:TIGR03862 family flavoprotein [Tropicibacter sp. R15_0]|uniref:TIGR03862 family flavoprotein n=1 Tax=Tropicibacter sp. R15_0 TaxID=2821101 RepID=UPI001ADA724E|nr:TIGR03862 family flavoprotein [Tropicibacter sp. R15_0]MBO9465719.1 TIGR03862 family flavoprotein [Tropicibacter sp. R15_0]
MSKALIIGGGPAGLMAAEMLLDGGHQVVLAEAKPTLARKFLMAGKSGLNLSKMEVFEQFLAAYRADAEPLRPMLQAFGPEDARAWAEALGQEMFTGSTGRLFPKVMKASPLLRAWITRLSNKGLEINLRWRWTDWQDGAFHFDTPDGSQVLTPDVTILALGGASWARLGSDGTWTRQFVRNGLKITPFAPSNAGLLVDWSPYMAKHFGSPIKNALFRSGDMENRGEAVISSKGLEGGGIYPLSPALRSGSTLHIDLFPHLSTAELQKRLEKPRGKQSLSNVLRKTLKIPPATWALISEVARPLPSAPSELTDLLKNLPLPHQGLRHLDEAISTTGGVPWASLTPELMLKDRPGLFCAGEMVDWDAPTGGYLLTACLAMGRWAGLHASQFLYNHGETVE